MIVYSDPTPRWVPFLLLVLVTIAGFWGSYNQVNASLAVSLKITAVLFTVLFVLIFLQGWLFWTGQVASIVFANGSAVATTMRWVGFGKRYMVNAGETSDWTAKPKHDDRTKLATVSFKVRSGETLELSFLSPKTVNLENLASLAPQFFAKLRADYPSLTNV